ncbi:ribonuclease HII [Pokkaliibacter plantistimulans]|uniref:Ribonuclease HII n=1 Tax=Proteobacteria bacterium 228 TaxID=2083153 RepID=A0A2S5KJS8_9PROT|nr:ribonuclease HII [Pokkaliibacter plantistimulans]PPC74885.1 ribonuclease HII [Pokkaliibacter plantistimulans]
MQMSMIFAGGLVAGVDEVGRGPLFGDVVTAAVILDPNKPVAGLADSKKLSESRRERLYEQICADALSYAIASASVAEIDELNILNATMLAMQRAIAALHIKPDYVMVDGNRCPQLNIPCEAVVGGDAKVEAISAASILAKVSRDRAMKEWAVTYPGYGLEQHKGYPTVSHLQALRALGPTPLHRRSFAPVKKLLSDTLS